MKMPPLPAHPSAMTRLGGGAFVISPEMSIHGIETRPGIVMDGVAAEHIREAVPVIASYADAIRAKLDYLVELRGEVRRLHGEGRSVGEIRRILLGRETLMSLLTLYHFSKTNLVRGCLAPGDK